MAAAPECFVCLHQFQVYELQEQKIDYYLTAGALSVRKRFLLGFARIDILQAIPVVVGSIQTGCDNLNCQSK